MSRASRRQRRHERELETLAASKKSKPVRRASEFDMGRLAALLRPPASASAASTWTLSEIRDARDAQLRGQFARPVALAASMRTNPATFTPWKNRLAPERCLGVQIEPAKGARGEAVAAEASALYGLGGVGIMPGAMQDLNSALANHGIAIGYNLAMPRDDGSRVDLVHCYWPLEHVRWDPVVENPAGGRGMLMTRIDTMATVDPLYAGTYRGAGEVPIVHGDGRWVVYQAHQHEPWRQDACVLSMALIWASHSHAMRDWAKGSSAHGNAKVVGEMPAGMSLEDENGNLSPQALAFLELLQAIASLDSPVGIRPAGSKTDYITNDSTAWQVWSELAQNGERLAARAYLGTDGTIGANGGAPGVDISALFGVATTIIQGDLGVLTRGFKSGVLDPWAAMNFGDSGLAPTRTYLIPDADAEAVRAAYATRATAYRLDVREQKELGFVIDQAILDELAERYDVEPMRLPVAAPPAPGGLSLVDAAE